MATLPTVYFIDDSATMREVIKIAFRRENINVLTSHDAVAALDEIVKDRPDIVITDVIMPVKDGYEVCQFIKTHPELSRIPVVLMSGVVNRAVAEKAFAVKADELLRKPFQPQDLISRVRNLLLAKGSARPSAAAAAANASAALSSIFSATAPMPPRSVSAAAKEPALTAGMGGPLFATLEPGPGQPVPENTQPSPMMSMAAPFSVVVPEVDPLLEVPNPPIKSAGNPPPTSHPVAAFTASPTMPVPATFAAMSGPAGNGPSANGPVVIGASPQNGAALSGIAKAANGEFNRPRIEILRLEGLVKKLQAELQAEREYSKALEAHIKTLQESER
jgi:CheY-like chemotaxis protein